MPSGDFYYCKIYYFGTLPAPPWVLQQQQQTYHPVFWYPAATDLGVDVDKKVTEHVLEELQRRELNVVASSFDGKSHQRVTTGLKGEPHTLIQLAKDHWKSILINQDSARNTDKVGFRGKRASISTKDGADSAKEVDRVKGQMLREATKHQ